MKMKAFGATDVGLKRKSNQDAILLREDMQLFAVADGMGGHKGGEIASQLSLDIIDKYFQKNRQMEPKALTEQMYLKACEAVFDKSQLDIELSGMGTTLVLCFRKGSHVYFGNVGDSRAYLFREEKLWLLTEDHSLVNEQLKKGIIEEEDVVGHESKNVITRSVGYERQVDCDFTERELDQGEFYILCSDGLHGLIDDEKILEICKKHDYHLWPDLMIEEAKKAGGDDNISVVAIFSGEPQEDS